MSVELQAEIYSLFYEEELREAAKDAAIYCNSFNPETKLSDT